MTSNKKNLKENKKANQGQGKSGKRMQKQPSEVFYKKGASINITKLTGKHLCQSQAETWNFNKKEILG